MSIFDGGMQEPYNMRPTHNEPWDPDSGESLYDWNNRMNRKYAELQAGTSPPVQIDFGEIDTKPSNPKDAIGSTKLPMGLVPDTIETEVALAYLEGACKYGRFNWRIAGVRSSIYRDAMRRHLAKWWNGEDADRKTRVKHLASIIASAGILLDAELCGKLNDDRPPAAPISDLIDSADPRVAHLVELFKDHHPKQYTIADTERPE